ncbi:dUTP diphosphatase [Thermodesulfobacteriota bacterium]
MNKPPVIKIVRLRPDKDGKIPFPRYMTRQSAGMDIYAVPEKTIVLEPGCIELVPTGFAMAIPNGYEAQIRPRSGLAVTHGIGLINSPGTIDADFRGEVKIALINFGKKAYSIRRGDRIAQMVVTRCCHAELEIVEQLDQTDRNTGGFGHTGV